MFVIRITYTAPIEQIDQYLSAHRAFLDKGYKEKYLLASGPQEPRIGGIILSQVKERAKLEKFIKEDPFLVNNLADYEIIEFIPVKYQPELARLLGINE